MSRKIKIKVKRKPGKKVKASTRRKKKRVHNPRRVA